MRASILRTVASVTPRRGSRHPLPAALGALVAGLVASLGGCGGVAAPSTDVSLGQTVMEMADAVNALREETGTMQAQIDSLRAVVARQDSTIARLANLGGVALPP